MLGGEALAHLYLQHIAELRHYLAQRVACREVARELAQETFLRMMLSDGKDAIRNPRAFLYRIATNLAVDHYRSEAGRPREILPLEDCAEQACPRPGPEQVASARQTLARLAAVVEQLPPRCREVFLRHKFDGCRQADLAREYGISVNAIEKHLIRALVQLRLCLH